uniref:protein LURP-one-related 15-like n=1 Tax=Erigeron canadensis TaxID=72917 RepID=UPI001CB9D376|nr:protein LURP-one-related 15-like [Erigeron canadensis]
MVVVDAQYVEPYTVDLAVQRKSGTNANGNFMVVDVNGKLMFKIKDTRFSFHDRHILYDATEKPVLTFKKKLRSIHGRWQAFKGDSTNHKDLLFSVKKSSTPKDEIDLDVFLVKNKEETVCDCKILGEWETKSCTIYAQDGSTVLAGVHEKQNIMNVEHGKDTFGITVYPEVDYVFIVALVVILTEIKCYDGIGKKKKRKKKEKKKNDSSSDDDDDDSKVYEEEPRYDEYDDNDDDNEESSSTSSEDESRDEDRKSS